MQTSVTSGDSKERIERNIVPGIRNRLLCGEANHMRVSRKALQPYKSRLPRPVAAFFDIHLSLSLSSPFIQSKWHRLSSLVEASLVYLLPTPFLSVAPMSYFSTSNRMFLLVIANQRFLIGYAVSWVVTPQRLHLVSTVPELTLRGIWPSQTLQRSSMRIPKNPCVSACYLLRFRTDFFVHRPANLRVKI